MNYQRQYEQKIGWKNSPDTSTPLNATNLNKMDNALNYMDEKLSEAVNGGIVKANPSGSTTSNLNKIEINGTVYGISGGGGGGDTYACLGIGKKTGVSSNVIDTDIDLHRSPMVGDRLLVYFDEKVTNPTGLTTYNNGTAVTSNLENAVSLYINAGWNILEFKNDGLLYDNCWVRKQNVPVPSTLAGMSDTLIVSPSDDQLLVYDNGKWKNKKFVEANVGFSDTELKKIKVGDVVFDTDGLRDYFVSSIANNNITISVLNSNQFVMENIAINTGAYSGSSSAWNLVLNDGMNPVSVALKNADGTAFSDDIHENELLFVYVDTAGNVAKVLDIPVNTTEIKTATGNPITLTDAKAGNALEVSAEIVASQDLHGYDKPWVGGSGKNILPMTLANLKAINNSVGTWIDNVWSFVGVTVTVVTDNGGNVTELIFNGTSTSTFTFYLVYGDGLAIDGAYTFSTVNDTPSNVYMGVRGVVNEDISPTTKVKTFTATGTLTNVRIWTDNNVAYNNYVYKPMLCLSSAQNPTVFEPYSNICPITGFSSVVITDVDSESHTATVTVALGSTVYGGTLNLTTGELTVTHANIASYNGETIGEPWISSMDEYTQGGTPTTGAQVVYTLATPTTTTLTAAQLALVKGQNTLTCNSGDMEITYKASGLDALKERVDELEDAVEDLETDMASKTENSVVGVVENGTTASQAYAVGEHFIRNDKFCTCISAIASGATLTQGTNYVEGTIAEAVNSSGFIFSETEHAVGWWLGKRLYAKTVNCGAMPSITSPKKVDAQLPTGSKVVWMMGYTAESSYNSMMPLPHADATSGANYNFQICWTEGKYITIKVTTSQAHMTVTYVTVYYFKD